MPVHKLQQACGFQMAPKTTLAEFAAQAAQFKSDFCTRHGICSGDVLGSDKDAQNSFETADQPQEKAINRAKRRKMEEKETAREARARVKREEEEQIERCFWRLVRTESEPVIVPYGADLDTATHT